MEYGISNSYHGYGNSDELDYMLMVQIDYVHETCKIEKKLLKIHFMYVLIYKSKYAKYHQHKHLTLYMFYFPLHVSILIIGPS
jgi:hypothetical protein